MINKMKLMRPQGDSALFNDAWALKQKASTFLTFGC